MGRTVHTLLGMIGLAGVRQSAPISETPPTGDNVRSVLRPPSTLAWSYATDQKAVSL